MFITAIPLISCSREGRRRVEDMCGCNKFFLSRIDKGASMWCIEYFIPKEGTARDEGGTTGADARSSEDAAGSSGCGLDPSVNRYPLPTRCVGARKLIKRVFITNVKGTFLGMSESEEASKRR